MGINVLFEIGHARARKGRLFTWPSSERSQVPLAHITLRYSCHQALASGAERVRDTERRQRETERNENKKKTETMQKKKKNGENVQKFQPFLNEFALMFIFNELQLSGGTLLALAHHGSAVCAHLWKQAITPTSLRTSSANRSQSLVLVWKLKPRVQSTSVKTHKPHSPCCFHFTQYLV